MAYGRRMSVNELARKIIELTGSKSEIRYLPPRLGDVKHSLASTERLNSAGFSPVGDFDGGLQATIDYFRHR